MAKGFLGLNPTAIGILSGGLLGGATGSTATAGIAALGGVFGALYDRSQGMARDAMGAMKDAASAGVKNQNAIVEEAYNKRKAAIGLGESGNPNPMKGSISSSQGIALNTNTGEATSLLG